LTEQLRYGVIGTGMMGIEHIRNIRVLDGARVAAVCDTNAQSLAAAQDALGDNVPAFENHIDLLAADICDALVVATPNMTHLGILLDIIDAGLPVLVEKPLCTTVSDCQRILAAAPPNALIWVGLEYRYIPAIEELIGKVREGIIGPVRMLGIREHRFPFLDKVDDWNRFNANTGGTLVEKCCHFFDLMRLIVQARPVRVYASGGQDVNHLDELYEGRQPDILDNAYVIVDFDSGARAMLDLCMFAEATRNQEEISVVGDRGKVEALIPDAVLRTGIRGRHWIGNVDEEPVENPAIRHAGYHHGSSYIEHLRFRDAVLGRASPESGLEAGLGSVALGEAAQLSIAEGRAIDMDEVIKPKNADMSHD